MYNLLTNTAGSSIGSLDFFTDEMTLKKRKIGTQAMDDSGNEFVFR